MRAPARSDALGAASTASTALGAACRSASAVSSAELRRSPPISAVISADALAALSTAALSAAALSAAALSAAAVLESGLTCRSQQQPVTGAVGTT